MAPSEQKGTDLQIAAANDPITADDPTGLQISLAQQPVSIPQSLLEEYETIRRNLEISKRDHDRKRQLLQIEATVRYMEKLDLITDVDQRYEQLYALLSPEEKESIEHYRAYLSTCIDNNSILDVKFSGVRWSAVYLGMSLALVQFQRSEMMGKLVESLIAINETNEFMSYILGDNFAMGQLYGYATSGMGPVIISLIGIPNIIKLTQYWLGTQKEDDAERNMQLQRLGEQDLRPHNINEAEKAAQNDRIFMSNINADTVAGVIENMCERNMSWGQQVKVIRHTTNGVRESCSIVSYDDINSGQAVCQGTAFIVQHDGRVVKHDMTMLSLHADNTEKSTQHTVACIIVEEQGHYYTCIRCSNGWLRVNEGYMNWFPLTDQKAMRKSILRGSDQASNVSILGQKVVYLIYVNSKLSLQFYSFHKNSVLHSHPNGVHTCLKNAPWHALNALSQFKA